MTVADLEAKVEALSKSIKKLEKQAQAQADIEAIKKLQRSYGFYLEHWQEDEIVELFSRSPDVQLEINYTGCFKGWEAIRDSFNFADHYTAYGVKKAPGEFLHILMPLAGIVDLGGRGLAVLHGVRTARSGFRLFVRAVLGRLGRGLPG